MNMNFKNSLFATLCTAIFFNALSGYAQTKYLKITLSEEDQEQVNFPPGTKFELTNDEGVIVYDSESSLKKDSYEIEGEHKLVVYPSWKKKTDVFYINAGKIELIASSWKKKSNSKTALNKKKKRRYDRNKYSGGLSMKKTLTPSDQLANRYNATFTFSNGIVATYTDGELVAFQGDKKLKVDNKYFIYTDSGIIRLSFRNTNGETWWVLDKSDNE